MFRLYGVGFITSVCSSSWFSLGSIVASMYLFIIFAGSSSGLIVYLFASFG